MEEGVDRLGKSTGKAEAYWKARLGGGWRSLENVTMRCLKNWRNTLRPDLSLKAPLVSVDLDVRYSVVNAYKRFT